MKWKAKSVKVQDRTRRKKGEKEWKKERCLNGVKNCRESRKSIMTQSCFYFILALL